MSGGGLVMLSVPLPVISRLLSLTCASPSTWPISWAKVQALAPLATAAPGRRGGWRGR